MIKLGNTFVTGATSGMGYPTVVELAKEGSKFIGIHYSSNEDRAKQLLKEVKSYGSDGIILKADMSKRDEVSKIVDQYKGSGGGKIRTSSFKAPPPRLNILTSAGWVLTS